MFNANILEHKEYYINEAYREVITRLIVTGGKDRSKEEVRIKSRCKNKARELFTT